MGYNSNIYGRMKADASLVWSDGAVKLYAEAFIYLNLPLIVYPWHPEQDLSLRLDNPLKKRFFAILLLVCIHDRLQRLQYFLNRLMKFRLRRILLNNLCNYLINI